ncbi:hypothetical protein ACQP2K_20450 [Microbispora siamensis]
MLHEVIETFTSAGWRVASFGTVTEPSSGTRGDMLERLRLRNHSVFAHFSGSRSPAHARTALAPRQATFALPDDGA